MMPGLLKETDPSTAFRWRDQTFAEALVWAAEHHGERVAVSTRDARLTYSELLARVEAFALGLNEIGVRRGDNIALWMTDTIEWVIARWAIPSFGAVLVPVNTRLRGDELSYIIDQSDASVLIMDAQYGGHDYLQTLASIVPNYEVQANGSWYATRLPKLKQVVVNRMDPVARSMTSFAAIEALGSKRRSDSAAFRRLCAGVVGTDVAQLLYTSGTTSLPKGAMVCHGPLLENNFNSAARTEMTADDAYLLTVPSFSATGVAAYCQCLTHGAKLVLMDRFSAKEMCRLIEQEHVTVGFFADPIIFDLRNFHDRKHYDLSSLRTGSGAPLSDASVTFLTDEIGVKQITRIYGMSETSNPVSRGLSSDSAMVRFRSNGRPQPDVTVTIVDPETGALLGPEEVGEIRISGYTVMKGYYKKPEETAAAFDLEGRLCSGDLGMLNQHGELVYVGRVKEMLKVGGFNIAPAEIEAFLEGCPGVERAAVVGVPAPRLGEVPFAFIEHTGETPPSADKLFEACRSGMAGYKVPRFLAFEGDWPMTGTQKVQKSQLRERALELISSGSVHARD
mgnify:CR=1 FL=1